MTKITRRTLLASTAATAAAAALPLSFTSAKAAAGQINPFVARKDCWVDHEALVDILHNARTEYSTAFGQPAAMTDDSRCPGCNTPLGWHLHGRALRDDAAFALAA